MVLVPAASRNQRTLNGRARLLGAPAVASYPHRTASYLPQADLPRITGAICGVRFSLPLRLATAAGDPEIPGNRPNFRLEIPASQS